MDLSTTYLGLKLPHPLIAGAGPLGDELDTVRALEDAASVKASAALLGLLSSSHSEWFQGHYSLDADTGRYTFTFNKAVLTGPDGPDVETMISLRNEAKRARNFEEADRIRDALRVRGIVLEDGPSGTTWRKE